MRRSPPWPPSRPGEELIRFPLLLTIVFGAHIPGDLLAAHLARHRKLHAARLAGYADDLARANAAPPGYGPDAYLRACLDFGLRYERAVLDWFDNLPEEILPGKVGSAS